MLVRMRDLLEFVGQVVAEAHERVVLLVLFRVGRRRRSLAAHLHTHHQDDKVDRPRAMGVSIALASSSPAHTDTRQLTKPAHQVARLLVRLQAP